VSVAVVTGGNRGIGLDVCRQLAELGYDVVLGSRDRGKGQRAAARLGGAVTPCQLDVADEASVRAARGRVVNVSSESGSLASMGGGTPAYSVAKAALNALTRILAAELRPAGVLVNAVCPGWTATDMGGHGGRPVAAGAASVVWGVTLPDGGPTGGFFRDGHPLPW
jgi:NAD(P)-dependent dehydrogenase (short-subunit alcohol dehydrogenase family)